MTEYIEKEAAIDNIEKSFDKETILNRFVRKIAISAVRRMEPADVRAVVHGKWIVKTDSEGKTYGVCSCCGYEQYAGHLKYCPECGGKMDGPNQ